MCKYICIYIYIYIYIKNQGLTASYISNNLTQPFLYILTARKKNEILCLFLCSIIEIVNTHKHRQNHTNNQIFQSRKL